MLYLASGVRTKTIPTPQTSGAVHVAVFTHTITKQLEIGDIVEIGALPGGCQLVGATVNSQATATTIDVGFMTGTYGDPSATRTVGNELFDGVARNADQTLSVVGANAIPSAATTRGIGIALPTQETVGAKTITVAIEYIA